MSEITLNVIQNNRYMDDILFASDNLSELEVIADESLKLFESRGFKYESGSLILTLNLC